MTVNTSVQCGRFQFACHSGECIAVYNACDGIPQCEDGSDEGPEVLSISVSIYPRNLLIISLFYSAREPITIC